MTMFFDTFMWKVRFRPGLLAFLVLVMAFLGAAPALAQSSYELSNRIKRLENEIETLSRAVYRGEASGSVVSGGGAPASADVEIRLQQIERELRDLVGMVEKQAHEIRQIRGEMERVTSDLELRMNELEGGTSSSFTGGDRGGGGLSSSSSRYTANPNQPAAGGNGPQGAADSYNWSSRPPSEGQLGSYTERSGGGTSGGDDAVSLYDSAFSLVKNRQYGGAESQFNQFLEKYPDHALAGNAKYWLGETFYVRGKFEQAARIFAEGYQEFPKGAKAADNLLKLGMSLAGLGKTQDACTALAQLDKDDIPGNAPVKRRAEQERSRLGC